jgi:hypothetical protein
VPTRSLVLESELAAASSQKTELSADKCSTGHILTIGNRVVPFSNVIQEYIMADIAIDQPQQDFSSIEGDVGQLNGGQEEQNLTTSDNAGTDQINGAQEEPNLATLDGAGAEQVDGVQEEFSLAFANNAGTDQINGAQGEPNLATLDNASADQINGASGSEGEVDLTNLMGYSLGNGIGPVGAEGTEIASRTPAEDASSQVDGVNISASQDTLNTLSGTNSENTIPVGNQGNGTVDITQPIPEVSYDNPDLATVKGGINIGTGGVSGGVSLTQDEFTVGAKVQESFGGKTSADFFAGYDNGSTTLGIKESISNKGLPTTELNASEKLSSTNTLSEMAKFQGNNFAFGLQDKQDLGGGSSITAGVQDVNGKFTESLKFADNSFLGTQGLDFKAGITANPNGTLGGNIGLKDSLGPALGGNAFVSGQASVGNGKAPDFSLNAGIENIFGVNGLSPNFGFGPSGFSAGIGFNF